MHLCVPLLLLLVPAQSADQKKATLAYLHKHEHKAGGFHPSPKAAAPTLRATSSCLRALRYFGGAPANLDGCKRFVLSCHDEKSGGFSDTPGGKPDVIVTAVGLMALVELKLPVETFEKGAIAFLAGKAEQFEQVRMAAAGLEAVGKTCDKNAAWITRLKSQQNADGTFGQDAGLPRDTGSAVACLLRLGGKIDNKDAVVKALDAGQRGDGGFGRGDAKGSDLESSYRIVRAYVMMKSSPKRSDDLKAFIGKCRNADGGYGVTPGAESSIGGTYFAGILLHWLGGK